MTLLSQQELLEPQPSRRIIVPRGHSAWWGVDPGSKRLAVAFVAPDGSRGVRTTSFADLKGPARLAEIWRETRRFVMALMVVHGFPEPGLVWIEQPSGKMENPALSYAVGVIQAAVFDGLSGDWYSAAVETITSSSWKKSACGRGNIYKPKRGQTFEYGVLTWARANGFAGSSWDEADAWGIAEAARRTVALDER